MQIKGLLLPQRCKSLGVESVMIDPIRDNHTIRYISHVTGELVTEKVPLIVAMWFSERL